MEVEEMIIDVQIQINKMNRILELLNKEEKTSSIEDCTNAELFYSLISNYSVQRKAPLSDKFVIKKLSFFPVAAKENQGDAKDKDNHYYEFKTSFTNKGNKLNLRQLRPWQNIDFYYCFFINEEDFSKSKIYTLTKQQMLNEIDLLGSAAHGTEKANDKNENIEYSITIDIYNNKNINTQRWNKEYLNLALMKEIFNVIR